MNEGLPQRLERISIYSLWVSKKNLAEGVQGALRYNTSYSKDLDIDDRIYRECENPSSASMHFLFLRVFISKVFSKDGTQKSDILNLMPSV